MKNHVILNYLDQPFKLLKWPATTVATVLAPSFFMVIMGRPLVGFGLSLLTAGGIRSYHRRFGQGSLLGVSYWILPHRAKKMPVTPPSHIREYIF